MSKLILEFDDAEIKLIAAVTHKVLIENPDNSVAQRLLDDLVEQTSVVKRDPKEHGIGIVPANGMYSEAAGVANGLNLTELHLYSAGNYG